MWIFLFIIAFIIIGIEKRKYPEMYIKEKENSLEAPEKIIQRTPIEEKAYEMVLKIVDNLNTENEKDKIQECALEYLIMFYTSAGKTAKFRSYVDKYLRYFLKGQEYKRVSRAWRYYRDLHQPTISKARKIAMRTNEIKTEEKRKLKWQKEREEALEIEEEVRKRLHID